MLERRPVPRIWPARIAILVSLIGVLGTSRPEGWSLRSPPIGPKLATSSRALAVEIDASHQPFLLTHGGPPSYGDRRVTPCLEPFAPGAKWTCLLAPGTVLDEVEIRGNCRGGGCTSSCPPPAGAFVNVTSSETPYWTDTATSDMTSMFPAHGPGWIATRLQVLVAGARLITVKLTVSDAAAGTSIFEDEQACTFEVSSVGRQGWCLFGVNDDLFKAPTNVRVVARATAWDLCPPGHAGGVSCPAPKTLRIDRLDFAT